MLTAFVPVRNGGAWIRESLRSLLEQTLPPSEILVADDASTDGTPEIVESLGSPLIRVLRHETHQGISANCNEMIRQAKGRYLARMDADDIALPHRFQLQMERFRTSDVSVLGTWAKRFGAAETLHTNPVEDADVRAKLGLACPFVNPTVIFDREPLGDAIFYDPAIPYGEDYAQFVRLRARARFGNIPEVTLLWRLHARNAGSDPVSLPQQNRTVSQVRCRVWEESGIRLDASEKEALDRLVLLPLPTLEESRHVLSAFLKALAHPEPSLWAPRSALRTLFVSQWNYYSLVRAWDGPGIVPLWWKGIRRLGGRPDSATFLKLVFKSILKR